MGAAPKYLLAVPTIDLIVGEPDLLDRLPLETLTALRVKCAQAMALVESAQLVAVNRANGKTIEAADDEMLTAAEGAALLRRKRSWLYRNWRRLPFVKRTGPRSPLLCSKAGIQRYLARL
jgi:hypothetical protein